MELRSNYKIELAREFILHTSANIFLTGKAGTGKTTFLRSIVRGSTKRTVVAAPTGVAALNAGGVTLHSLFQLDFAPFLPGVTTQVKGRFSHRFSRSKLSLIRSIELLIIDEVSMVRGDMLDAVDQRLRTIRQSPHPFGGVQLLLIGDVQQLSPICVDGEWELLREHYATPYFFDSQALRRTPYVMVEFDEIFRQKDSRFTTILNAVRENIVTHELLEELNRRYIPSFTPPKGEEYITLTTHNATANAINSRELGKIGNSSYNFEATISGDFAQSAYPNDLTLELKKGAQVLFIKNDPSPERRFYNGLIGKVVDINSHSVTVKPRDGGDPIKVESLSWDNIEYHIDEQTGEMELNIKGSFTQIPLRCAWAITIHKSQGLSFDRAIIDARGSFAHGQVYVALSRCRTLEGMVLSAPISMSSIIGEQQVDNYASYVSENQPDKDILWECKRHYYLTTLLEIFNFEPLERQLWELNSEMTPAVKKSYPKLAAALSSRLITFDREVMRVGVSFQRQLSELITQSKSEGCNYDNDYIRERLARAADYFRSQNEEFAAAIRATPSIELDSKERQKRLESLRIALRSYFALLFDSLELCSKGFSMERYSEMRARIIARQSFAQERAKSAPKSRAKSKPKRKTNGKG